MKCGITVTAASALNAPVLLYFNICARNTSKNVLQRGAAASEATDAVSWSQQTGGHTTSICKNLHNLTRFLTF